MKFLKELRLTNKLSKEYLSEYLCISDYEKLENGDRMVTTEELNKLKKLYNIDLVEYSNSHE